MADRASGEQSLRSVLLRMLLVVALSIAVWTFAEARSLTNETQTVTLVLAAPAGAELTAWIDSNKLRRETVSVRLEGSRAALQRAAQRLREPVELLIGESLAAQPGDRTVNLRDVLRDHRVFDRLAVSLVEVTPGTIDVHVDEVVQETIPIRVRADSVALERPPVADPPSVTVTGPASILRDASFDVLEAVAPADELAELVSGSTAQFPGLTVVVPAPWRNELVRVSPITVTATISLRDTIESLPLSSVPVMVRLSPTQLRQWSVRIAPENAYLRDVEVRGPREAVEAIRSGRQRVVATIQLESVELSVGEAEFQAVVSSDVSGLTFVVADTAVPVIISAIETPADGEGGE